MDFSLKMPAAATAPNVPTVASVQCNYCSKWLPEWRVHRVTNAQVICEYCLDWHLHALEFLGGAVPRGCQVCGLTWETMRDFSPNGEVRLYVVPKDGIYQVLCGACVAPYLPKRADLYRGTEFGSNTLNL